jgi:hypothetical protein
MKKKKKKKKKLEVTWFKSMNRKITLLWPLIKAK